MSRIEDEVCEKIGQRAKVGLSKYGVTMDLAVYLQKLIEMEMKE